MTGRQHRMVMDDPSGRGGAGTAAPPAVRGPVSATMGCVPLTVGMLFGHSRWVHSTSEVVTLGDTAMARSTFAEVADRADRLAAALAGLGVGRGDRVGTFAWNTQQHLEAYLAVPSMGAVLHTVNIRLSAAQIAFVINHAGDKVLLVDPTLLPVLEPIMGELTTVEHVVVTGPLDGAVPDAVVPADDAFAGMGRPVHSYEELLRTHAPDFVYPDVDEDEPAAMCYTSGTTGNPRGVVYSHRSTYLHAMGTCMGEAFGISERDRVLPIVPMFHANAWGLPYAAWLAGADLIMPGRFLQAEPLCQLIAAQRPTIAGGVPTIWNDVLHFAEQRPVDLSSIRIAVCGGSAVPTQLVVQFQERHGVTIVQGWGMTETSPLAALAWAPKDLGGGDAMTYRSRAGRIHSCVQIRAVDDAGTVLARDGTSVGEIEVRGPWVTAAYFGEDAPERFHDGWLRTGDVGTIDPRGYVQITDRAKDIVKSGGEWISSVELENALMDHPAVLQAAVVAVPDERWGERPLGCVVLDPAAAGTDLSDLRRHLESRVAHWWVPERWALVDAVPLTSVGKFDKKDLRRRYHAGELHVTRLDAPPPPRASNSRGSERCARWPTEATGGP